jgi:hypothetical protein
LTELEALPKGILREDESREIKEGNGRRTWMGMSGNRCKMRNVGEKESI